MRGVGPRSPSRAVEAVYDVRAGDNRGWSEREGRYVHDPTDERHLHPVPDNDDDLGHVYPVASFDHDPPPGWPCRSDSGHGISGGFVYRGGGRRSDASTLTSQDRGAHPVTGEC